MFAQSTLISYHTEPFVKTESACTVFNDNEPLLNGLENNRISILFREISIETKQKKVGMNESW